jgi:hypothetical protein
MVKAFSNITRELGQAKWHNNIVNGKKGSRNGKFSF